MDECNTLKRKVNRQKSLSAESALFSRQRHFRKGQKACLVDRSRPLTHYSRSTFVYTWLKRDKSQPTHGRHGKGKGSEKERETPRDERGFMEMQEDRATGFHGLNNSVAKRGVNFPPFFQLLLRSISTPSPPRPTRQGRGTRSTTGRSPADQDNCSLCFKHAV